MAQTVLRDDEDRLESTTLRICLLGPLAVVRKGQDLEVVGPKRRALLTLLAMNVGRPVGRDRIIEALWPHQRTGREESTLRTHVSYLRDGIEPNRDDPVVLLTRGPSYMLNADQVELDVDHFRVLVEAGRDGADSQPEHALALFDEALRLWSGRPLQDVEYEDFAQEEIRALEEARVEAVAERARTLVSLGNLGAAVSALEPLVRERPEWEDPAIALMRALYGNGRHTDSLAVARRYRRHLAERGLEPSPRLIEIEDQILNHDPALSTGGRLLSAHDGARGYELRDQTGAGSVGVVYRAFQASVGREVAVKVVHPSLAGSGEFVRRFADEARVVASLEHPHIVPLYDFWRDPSGAFLVMRWMGGGSLDDRLGPGWTAGDLFRIFDQVADAISYSHSAGMVHRGIKPANVLFDDSGNAYLTDFGLATWGIDTGIGAPPSQRTLERPYASPEVLRHEGPTAASDIYGLGAMLAEAAQWLDAGDVLRSGIDEVVGVATAVNPADRYPDAEAFRRALAGVLGDLPVTLPRRVRRNPYKGLRAFDEGDATDFYGRDDFVEWLLDAVATRRLVAVVAASGSGKSSVVKAGLIPEIREGAITGSDEWFVVTMVPGVEPFDEFRVALRASAMADTNPVLKRPDQELRESFAAALGPSSQVLLFIDQFEELFASHVDPNTRERFLDNLVDLASDASGRVRTVVTLRADFSDRPLSHPRFGGLMARATSMLGPMTPEELERVTKLPAVRVGVEVEPGLVSEIVRDLSDTPAALPMLQYILAELFERRSEDRLTVHAYRALGGIHGILERQAEVSFNALAPESQTVCRQVFLRMVQLGDHGEETRRRVALTELRGLGAREAIGEVVETFTSSRILTSDRDPVSRVPTVEVSHETVISRWTRLRVWLDESRSDLSAQRRLAAAAEVWTKSGEDPEYLLIGGPLAAATALALNERVSLNDTEARFVESSRQSVTEAETREQERRQHEADLEQRSRRRLVIGVGAVALAAVVAVLGGLAIFERQRANTLAATQERQSQARELAAASLARLGSPDPDLGLLLAIEAADLSIEAGEPVLPEVVDALHHALMRTRPVLTIQDALGDSPGEGVSYSRDGASLAYVTNAGTISVVSLGSGFEMMRTSVVDPPAWGVDFHPSEERIMSIHSDGVREWAVPDGGLLRQTQHPEWVTTAAYSDDGRLIAVGDESGAITVYEEDTVLTSWSGGHDGPITSVDFDPAGARVVSAGQDGRVRVWNLVTGTLTTVEPDLRTQLCVYEASWHPSDDEILVTLCQGEAFAFDAETGLRLRPFSMGTQTHPAMVYDVSGSAVVGAGNDGVARIFNAEYGGSSLFDILTSGGPVTDVEFNPVDPAALEVATLGLDGTLQIWRAAAAWSERPHVWTGLRSPYIDSTPNGDTFVVGGNDFVAGLVRGCVDVAPMVSVYDAPTGRVLATHETICTLGRSHQAAITDDGRLAAGTAPSGNVFVLDVENEQSSEIPDSENWTWDLDFSSDSRILAGVGEDGQVAIWDVESMTMTSLMSSDLDAQANDRTPFRDSGQIQVEFLPDSDQLVTAGLDGSVLLWTIGDGTSRALAVLDFPLGSIDISADGETVVASDITGNLRVIDIATGQERLPRPQSVSGPTKVVISPDGRFLAGGGPGPIVHLWEVESGEIVRRIGRALGPPTVAFVNGGREIRAASIEGIIRAYVLDPVELLGIAERTVGRDMTEEECQRFLRRSCDA